MASEKGLSHWQTLEDGCRHWQSRAAQLYYSTGFARTRYDVVAFATEALKDKSIEVRYRACGLLAFAQRKRTIPKLQAVIENRNATTATYASAAIDAICQKTIEPFTALDTSKRNFYHLPFNLPCRSRYSTFAEEFDAISWRWIRKLGFERQFVFQHDAYYRKGNVWFHAYWEQWDVLWLFMLGRREELEQSYVGSMVPQPMRGGTLEEASKALSAQVPAVLEERMC